MSFHGRRIRLRARQRSLSFLKRRKIRRKSKSLTVVRRLPNVSASSDLPRTTAAGSRDREGKDTYLPPADSSVVNDMNEASLSGDEGCTHASAYRKRQQKSVSAWLSVRDQMLRASIECSVPSSNAKCFKCEDKLAVIICLDCGPQACYCEECVESAHSKENILHKPRIWKVL